MSNRHCIVLALAIAAALSFALLGCPPAANTAANGNDNASGSNEDNHDHANENHDHDNHDHGNENGHAHGGEHHELGEVTILGHTLAVTQIDHVHAGEEAVFEVKVTGGGKPATVRVWVGVESGEGSRKTVAGAAGDMYDAHVDVPATLPEDAEVWLEVETADGSTDSGSVPFKVE